METKQKFEFRSDQQTRTVNAKIKQIIVLLYGTPVSGQEYEPIFSLDSVTSYSANGKDGNILCHKIIFSSASMVMEYSLVDLYWNQ